MGKKYIVELEDGEHLYKTTKNSIDNPVIRGAACKPYTEPDLEQVNAEKDKIYDEARARGYEEGKARGYQEGLFDAWEAARKIWEYDTTTLKAIFGEGIMRMDWFMNFTASEAIEKLKAYEQEQDAEIKVGDEVQFKNTGSKFVVTRIFASEEGRKCEGLFDDGEVYESVLDGGNVEKTGRTFPEIAAVLEKMRGEQDGET